MKKFREITEMIALKTSLPLVETEIYKAFNADKPKITWKEHEILYKLINRIYND